MARSFSSSRIRAIRDANRAARAADNARAAQIRYQERLQKIHNRQAKLDYIAARQAEADDKNQSLANQVRELETILAFSLANSPTINLKSLYRQINLNDLPLSLKTPITPIKAEYEPNPLGFIAKLIPGSKAKYLKAVETGEAEYRAALTAFEQSEIEYAKALKEIHDEVDAHNREIDAFQKSLDAGLPSAIKAYAELVIDNSVYPENFPQDARVEFIAESNQLVLDLRAPLISDIIPDLERVKYVKNQDAIVDVKRSEKVRQSLYSEVIAQISIRTLHELFVADTNCHIHVIVLNIYVIGIDSATGAKVQPYIVSIRVSRDDFMGLQIAAVDPIACLKHLKASVSRSPTELVPVRPIFDINTADPRFISEQDVLSTLDTRPNLMALTPGEFESLITNLFQTMGLDTKLTQASRDGGVDCVAFDPRPVLGGKVIVQAKRYKNTVGVSAVRDLFGTVHNEGASKGILVTTSGFGKAAYSFANDKPLELITGSNLLFLLREHAGVDAKIEPPDDWRDPVLDIGN